jgi:spore coat protein A, manganese oxidase
MRNLLTKVGFAMLFASLLVVSVFAQNKLRTAVNYDTDTKADFVVFRPSNNVWYILKSGGGFTFTQFGSNTDDYMTPGDFDGDGKGDIAVWRDTNGAWYYLRSSDNAFVGTQFGSTGDEPIARDYDGDGKTDVAVVRRTGGNMFWYRLNSGNGAFVSNQFGLSGDFTAPGDYDGDGKFDLAVQRPGATAASQGIFYIQRSSTNTLSAIFWGNSNDTVVPGDYDGDGKTDVAIVQEGATANSPLIWGILKSSTGTPDIAGFGLTGADFNTQNDYDGDGKCDIAVWREAAGVFYYRSSANANSLASVTWGAPNDFPVASYDSH